MTIRKSNIGKARPHKSKTRIPFHIGKRKTKRGDKMAAKRKKARRAKRKR